MGIVRGRDRVIKRAALEKPYQSQPWTRVSHLPPQQIRSPNPASPHIFLVTGLVRAQHSNVDSRKRAGSLTPSTTRRRKTCMRCRASDGSAISDILTFRVDVEIQRDTARYSCPPVDLYVLV
jgi:hypothetical protein